MVESLRFDIQSTGQKSHRVITRSGAFTMLCFNETVGFPRSVPVLSSPTNNTGRYSSAGPHPKSPTRGRGPNATSEGNLRVVRAAHGAHVRPKPRLPWMTQPKANGRLLSVCCPANQEVYLPQQCSVQRVLGLIGQSVRRPPLERGNFKSWNCALSRPPYT